MSDAVIKVKGISKSYKISHQLERNAHPTLRDDIAHFARKPLEWIGAAGGQSKEMFWALKDIDFEVQKGEVVGILGRNGSGKSTLFEILSRVVQPTSGTAELIGKTASMLEVGTGFHPELTGRENVYFNGSILGMSKKEIDERFDDIVRFAEVEKFLDTPVKFYSSGMKVRLAFSVAAHLDADILIIDEVLAVGDVKFKKKSLEHMKKIAETDEKTILFVSHIVSQIESLCNRGIVLDNGQIVYDGTVENAVERYLELNETDDASFDDDVYSNPDFQSSGIEIEGLDIQLDANQGLPNLNVSYTLKNTEGLATGKLWLGMIISNANGNNVALVDTESENELTLTKEEKEVKIQFNVNDLNLRPGKYYVRLGIRDDETATVLRRIDSAGGFVVPEYELGGKKIRQPKETQPPLVLKSKITKK